MRRFIFIISVSTISLCDGNTNDRPKGNNFFHDIVQRAKENFPPVPVPAQPLFPPSSVGSAAATGISAGTGTGTGNSQGGTESDVASASAADIAASVAATGVQMGESIYGGRGETGRGSSILSSIHQQNRLRKIKLFGELPLPPLLRRSREKLSLLQRQVLIAIPTSLSSLSVELKNNFVESNIQNIELPFTGRGGSSTVAQRRARGRTGSSSDSNSNLNENTSSTKVQKKKRRKNNTGFYYGIQDDVFFPQNDNIDNNSNNNNQNGISGGDNNRGDRSIGRREGDEGSVFQRERQQQQRQQEGRELVSPPSSSSSSSSALGDIMGETLLELREMREDIMALREEMHYMKEEMKRNNRMRSQQIDQDDYETEGEGERYDDQQQQQQQPQMRSLTERVMRQKEFDHISKDVEKWAHRLLFEEDGEEDGWKEIMCNKMVRKKFNNDGSTKCYLKWMKDSRKSNEEQEDDSEYPCIKCYSTINAPIEKVCDYLSQESNMPEYNDLVIAYRDLEDVSPQGKICWSQCPQILFIKPRDFVTFCHHRWRKDGTQIVVNQACEHEDAPGNNEESEGKICRAHALRGANFISRDPDDPNKTRMAILAHANPGGGVPQWAMKTAVNAVAPIEPFKLFHRIDARVCAFCNKNMEQKTNMVNSYPQSSALNQKPAGLSQLGYACFWPIDNSHKLEGEYEYNSEQSPAHGEQHIRNEYIRRESGLQEQGDEKFCVGASFSNSNSGTSNR